MKTKKDAGIEKTLEELEGLNKSAEQEEGSDPISALEKALTDFDSFEEEFEKSEGDESEDGYEEEEEEEEEEFGKSESDDLDLEDELIKASEAYESLEKSVAEMGASTDQKFEDVVAAVADLTSLVKSIGGAVVTTVKENRELRKALVDQFDVIGKLPGMSSNGLQLGLNLGLEKSHKEDKDNHSFSKAEVTDALVKAVRDENMKHLSHYMSKVACNGPAVVPPEVLKEIGLLV
jgi:hypothetical protein